jgi:hypothetical protein
MNKRLQIERRPKEPHHGSEPLPLFPSVSPGLRLQLVEDASDAPGRGQLAGQRTRLTDARAADARAQLLACCGPQDHPGETLEEPPHDYRAH